MNLFGPGGGGGGGSEDQKLFLIEHSPFPYSNMRNKNNGCLFEQIT